MDDDYVPDEIPVDVKKGRDEDDLEAIVGIIREEPVVAFADRGLSQTTPTRVRRG